MKPTAYEGKEPYIFVSYAHKNRESVYEVLSELQRHGYRFWYNEDTTPGGEWSQDTAQYLDTSTAVIAFITPASMRSTVCQQEIEFSLSHGKPLLPIMLEPTGMSIDMEMRLSTQQMIMRWSYDRWDRFIEAILGFPGIEPCRTLRPASIRAFEETASPAPAAQIGAALADNATVILDPEPYEESSGFTQAATPETTTAQAAQKAQAFSREQTQTPAIPSAQAQTATQAPLSSTGTVWAGAPSQPAQPAAQPADKNLRGKPSNKRPLILVVVGIVAAMAIAFLALGPLGASGHSGCSFTPGSHQGKPAARSPELAEVVAHPPFMLEDVISESTDDTIAILRKLNEYQNEYGEYSFTADSEMATFYTEVATSYDDSAEEDMRAYLTEHASSLPWRMSTWNDRSSVSLASIESEGVDPANWDYESYLHCSSPTSEDVASYVAEVFDYEGIVLYRLPIGRESYQIRGYALSDEATLIISASNNDRLHDYWNLYLYVTSIDDRRMLDSFIYLCEDESHRSSLEDVYIEQPGEDVAVYQDALREFDEKGYEEQLHGFSASIGSDFDMPFDLANLVNGSPSDVGTMLDGLAEIVNTGTYSDGEEWMDVYYTTSEDMGRCMELDVDGDGYTDGWYYKEDHLDSAPWYICLFDEGKFVTRENIASGKSVSSVLFYGMIPAEDPTCEEAARYVKEAYGFDKIILYLDPETDEIEGYASTGDTTAWITGQDKSVLVVDTTDVGTYRIRIEVSDISDASRYDDFLAAYNNAALPDRYSDAYKE